MLKVLIVDDEMLARVGIKSLIPWSENGFEVIGECENGEDAYNTAIKVEPDIIITDINMPIKNGIKLIQDLNAYKLNTKYIVLSSYDDFKLVKDAMKAGAEDYILKLELEKSNLLEILLSIKDKILKESSIKSKQVSNYTDMEIIKERLLKDLLYGKEFNLEKFKDIQNKYNISLLSKNLICLVIKVDETAHTTTVRDSMFKSSLKNIISGSIKGYGIGEVVHCDPDIYTVLCSIDNSDENSISQSIIRMVGVIRDVIKNSMNVSVSIGVSDIHNDYSEIRKTYLEAMEAMSLRFTSPSGCILMYSKVRENNIKDLRAQLDQVMNELSISLKSNSISTIQPAFYNLIKDLKNSRGISEKFISGHCHTFIFIINEFIKNNKISETDIWGLDLNYYNLVFQHKNLKDYISWMEIIKDRILITLQKANQSSTVILRAKQYVHKHINMNISLTIMAEHLDLSPSYFSRLFSKSTGQGFIDYITEEKISVAKELIRSTNKKIYEVANDVGYENIHYFSRVFKKVVGMSPLDYKVGISQNSST